MNYATVVISGNRACVVDRNTVTAGTIGGRVTFTFDKTWDGMEKTLVWKGSGVTLDDTACTGLIPAEAVAQAGGHLMVGVYGTCGDTATPTLWADLGVILPGADPSGDETTDPTLPVWAQLQQQLAAQEETCGKVKTVNGFEPDENGNVVIEGGLGEPGPAGPQGPQGEPGKTPVKGVDYFTEADKQEIAQQAAQLVEIPHVPQNVSAFENDAGYQTDADVEGIVAEAMKDIPIGGGGGVVKTIVDYVVTEPVSKIRIPFTAEMITAMQMPCTIVVEMKIPINPDAEARGNGTIGVYHGGGYWSFYMINNSANFVPGSTGQPGVFYAVIFANTKNTAFLMRHFSTGDYYSVKKEVDRIDFGIEATPKQSWALDTDTVFVPGTTFTVGVIK